MLLKGSRSDVIETGQYDYNIVRNNRGLKINKTQRLIQRKCIIMLE